MVRFLASSVFLIYLCSAFPATAQLLSQKVKDLAAKEEAGIASYQIIIIPNQVDPPSVTYAVGVDVFDEEDQPLAACEVEWREESKVMTCTLPQGARFQATWYQDRVEFADLDTGDHISLRKEGVPAQKSAYQDPTKSRLEHGEWIVRGTKTMEEAERDWGHITSIFGYLLAELEITLQMIPGDRLFLDRRIYRPKQLRLPLKFDPCNGGPSYCDSSDVCPISGVFANTRNACCAEASRRADACCQRFTLRDCCANTICSVICPLNLYCECFLDGWKKKCGEHPNCPPPPFP